MSLPPFVSFVKEEAGKTGQPERGLVRFREVKPYLEESDGGGGRVSLPLSISWGAAGVYCRLLFCLL